MATTKKSTKSKQDKTTADSRFLLQKDGIEIIRKATKKKKSSSKK